MSQTLYHKPGFLVPAQALWLRLQLSHCLTWDKHQDTQVPGPAKRNLRTLFFSCICCYYCCSLRFLFHLNCDYSDFCHDQMKVEMPASPRDDTELFKQLLLDTCTGFFWHSTKDQHSETRRFSSRWVHSPPTDQWGESCSSACSWCSGYSSFQPTCFPVRRV